MSSGTDVEAPPVEQDKADDDSSHGSPGSLGSDVEAPPAEEDKADDDSSHGPPGSLGSDVEPPPAEEDKADDTNVDELPEVVATDAESPPVEEDNADDTNVDESPEVVATDVESPPVEEEKDGDTNVDESPEVVATDVETPPVEEDNADDTNRNGSSENDNGVTFTLKLGPKEILINELQIPYILMIVASIVLWCNIYGFRQKKAYGISVAVVTMVISMAALAISATKEKMWKNIGGFVNIFLMTWNFVGVVILTFHGPFFAASNGYFAIWAMYIFSMIALYGVKSGEVTDRLKKFTALFGLYVASIILFFAIVFLGYYDWKGTFSLVVSIMTFWTCIVFFYLERKGHSLEEVKTITLGICAFLWLLVVIVLTFPGGIFFFTGNGFFAAWAGLFFCIYAAAVTCN